MARPTLWVLSLLQLSYSAHADQSATLLLPDDEEFLDLDDPEPTPFSDSSPTLIYSSPVHSENGSLISTISIYDDDEPADAAFDFVTRHNLTAHYQDLILVDACEHIECWRAEAVLFQLDVELDHGEEELVILQNEDPVLVINEFCHQHSLDDDSCSILLDAAYSSPYISPPPPPPDPSTPLYSSPVAAATGALIGTVNVFPQQEPADVAAAFTRLHELPLEYYNAILADACETIECERVEPAVFRLPVDLGSTMGKTTLTIVEFEPNPHTLHSEDDAFDQVLDFCEEHGVGAADRSAIVKALRANNIEVDEREVEARLIWSQGVTMEGDVSLGTAEVFEGEEPVDAIYDFLWLRDSESTDPADTTVSALTETQRIRVLNGLLDLVCSVVRCNRRKALMWSEEVETAEGEYIGTVEVLQQDEPIDAINRFTNFHGLDREFRQNILAAACEDLECARSLPLAFTQDVAGEGNQVVGAMQVLEGEEVVDAVVKFVIDKAFPVDIIWLKNHFFVAACDYPGLKCTRNVAMMYDKEVSGPDGQGGSKSLGNLVIMENEEPVDKMWLFLTETVEDERTREEFFFNLKPQVCKTKYVTCNRDAPLIFGPQVITGPDGNAVGSLEVMLGEEPVDATYKFFARCGLFEKDWDFKQVFDQVCGLPGLEGKCNRGRAVKFVGENVTIGDTNKTIGNLVVWEEEEIVDALYERKMELNLTTMEMYTLFYQICKNPEVYCKRNRAVVATRIVNKLDYDKNMASLAAGNGTCLRQFMGWKYIAGWKMYKKDEIMNWLLRDDVKGVYGGNAFAWQLYWVCVLCVRLSVGVVIRLPLVRRWKERLSSSKKRSRWWAMHMVGGFLLCSWLWALAIEPKDSIDWAMHDFTGLIKDFPLEVMEGQQVADAVWDWAKRAEKVHHPLLRKPVHWGLIDELCEELGESQCSRKKAHDRIDFGAITMWGINNKIDHWKSPNRTMEEEIGMGLMRELGEDTCSRLVPTPPNCVKDMEEHNEREYRVVEGTRMKKKNLYTKLGMASDASTGEIFLAAKNALNKLGDNVSPFARIDNGTEKYHRWDDHVAYTYGIKDKIGELLNEKDREWFDKPCEPVFGGAMCAKKDASGNMMIEMGGSEE